MPRRSGNTGCRKSPTYLAGRMEVRRITCGRRALPLLLSLVTACSAPPLAPSAADVSTPTATAAIVTATVVVPTGTQPPTHSPAPTITVTPVSTATHAPTLEPTETPPPTRTTAPATAAARATIKAFGTVCEAPTEDWGEAKMSPDGQWIAVACRGQEALPTASLRIVYTFRGAVIRIISARKATHRERKQYEGEA